MSGAKDFLADLELKEERPWEFREADMPPGRPMPEPFPWDEVEPHYPPRRMAQDVEDLIDRRIEAKLAQRLIQSNDRLWSHWVNRVGFMSKESIDERRSWPVMGPRGQWMRSTLEGRWALIFNRLGLPYRYEPYRVGLLLPDFVFEKYGWLVSIKPKDLEKHTGEVDACGWKGSVAILGNQLGQRTQVGICRPAGEKSWRPLCVTTCVACSAPVLDLGGDWTISSTQCWVCRRGAGDDNPLRQVSFARVWEEAKTAMKSIAVYQATNGIYPPPHLANHIHR